jgi:hypothetical protein
MDERPEVLEWRSEEVIVPYFDPTTGRHRRYFPDIVALIQMKETKEPKVQKKRTKKYVTEVTTWATNQAKWKSAQEYCKDRGWDFALITEHQLGIKK